ncbi:putative like subfamily B member 12 [Rosellinia necatrix]|uniref:Putative like subfamily B member 12 n=1 Tax=Rosellinia necatrix TaxID=77044 RepID=A0A1S7UK91_ROSNE|nr:putative like subfamily B member 12 [Rosellinia necatrix]
MSSAKASGADAGGGSSSNARSRDHNQGNQERKSTPEQRAAVLRIRRCKTTAFYEILDLEATRSSCTDADIKKAYRKQSLLTHPDKNGHEGADEAFKMVSKAFSVLGDKEKRDRFDRFGTDPESRFESARAQAQNPFGGFGGRAAGAGQGGGFGRGGGMFDDEISPEEMFARFFGGGFGGPFGAGGFDAGPQFVFNVGGNRGFRVHQFGGAGPRRRPHADAPPGQQQQQASGWDTLVGLLPILVLFVFPLLTSMFSGFGESQPSVPNMVFDSPHPPQTYHRTTPKLHVNYYVDPNEIAGWQDHRLRQLDKEAEAGFVRVLRRRCDTEMRTQQDLIDKAQGWFFPDPDKMQIARDFEMPSCKRLDSIGIAR